MFINWMQKMGAVISALAITVIAILAALMLEFGMSLISGEMHTETIIKCIIYPGIITPIVAYILVRVTVRLAGSSVHSGMAGSPSRQKVHSQYAPTSGSPSSSY